MLTILAEEGIRGGWFLYWYCFPGCLPDSESLRTLQQLKDAQENYNL